MGRSPLVIKCMFTSGSPLTDELCKHVEQLWKGDTSPHQQEKEVIQSKQDKQASVLLEANTICTDVKGVLMYATPLLRHAGMPQLKAVSYASSMQHREASPEKPRASRRLQVGNAETH